MVFIPGSAVLRVALLFKSFALLMMDDVLILHPPRANSEATMYMLRTVLQTMLYVLFNFKFPF